MNPEQFELKLKEQGIKLNEQQLSQFEIYYNELIKWNKKVNLTGLTEKSDVYLKHFYDSLSPSIYFDFNKKMDICDVGAGAGFPSIPLKIVFPHLKITIVDSLKKRIDFLTHLVDKLQLDNISIYHARAEDFGQDKKFRENFDIVMARAVARMSVLSELCLPLTKKDGFFMAMKGSKALEELDDAEQAIKFLGGKTKDIKTFTLPSEESNRSIILIEKKTTTPKKYPRKAGTPNRSPIK